MERESFPQNESINIARVEARSLLILNFGGENSFSFFKCKAEKEHLAQICTHQTFSCTHKCQEEGEMYIF